MAPASRCGPPNSPDGRASGPTARLGRARSSSSPSQTAEGRDEAGIPVRDPGSVSYSAAIESAASRDTDDAPSAFAARVDREARRRGFDRAPRRVVLDDGAPWIWNLAAEQFPGAIEIVDLFHAKQHLSDVARAIYGPDNDLRRQWARQRHDELDDGELDALHHALASTRRPTTRPASASTT